MLQQERSPTKWNLALHVGNLGYIFGRIFVLPNTVGRTHCQQALIPQICLNFDVWHMNSNSDMTSMRKNHLLSSSHSRQLWEATGWLTECSEEHVSSIWGWVPHASSVRELYWHHVWCGEACNPTRWDPQSGPFWQQVKIDIDGCPLVDSQQFHCTKTPTRP